MLQTRNKYLCKFFFDQRKGKILHCSTVRQCEKSNLGYSQYNNIFCTLYRIPLQFSVIVQGFQTISNDLKSLHFSVYIKLFLPISVVITVLKKFPYSERDCSINIHFVIFHLSIAYSEVFWGFFFILNSKSFYALKVFTKIAKNCKITNTLGVQQSGHNFELCAHKQQLVSSLLWTQAEANYKTTNIW